MRRAALAAILAACLLTLTACWDYRGLDEMTIVSGMALDLSDSGGYTVTFEVIDLQTPQENGQAGSACVQADGGTIFEAVDKAGNQLHGQLYFGNMEVLIVSEALARTVGLEYMVNDFLRDTNIREKLLIAISREKTAGEIITPGKGGGTIRAYLIDKNLNEKGNHTDYTRPLQLYQIYNRLTLGADNLALPAFRLMDKDSDSPQPLLDGMAIFDGSRLAGFLPSRDVPVFMFITTPRQGGSFVYQVDIPGRDEKSDATLAIISSRPTLGFRLEGDVLTLTCRVEVSASISQLDPKVSLTHYDQIKAMEREAARALEVRICRLVTRLQQDTGIDIFGFGDRIYRQSPQVWARLKDDWRQQFKAARVEAACQFSIGSTGLIRN